MDVQWHEQVSMKQHDGTCVSGAPCGGRGVHSAWHGAGAGITCWIAGNDGLQDKVPLSRCSLLPAPVLLYFTPPSGNSSLLLPFRWPPSYFFFPFIFQVKQSVDMQTSSPLVRCFLHSPLMGQVPGLWLSPLSTLSEEILQHWQGPGLAASLCQPQQCVPGPAHRGNSNLHCTLCRLPSCRSVETGRLRTGKPQVSPETSHNLHVYKEKQSKWYNINTYFYFQMLISDIKLYLWCL